jgi:arsenite methyltransferase
VSEPPVNAPARPQATMPEPAQIKQCCANIYGSDAAKFLLGDSFHPGGAALTHELASRLNLSATSTVLDAASGKGATALLLAETCGCRVIGIDLSDKNIAQARSAASVHNLDTLVSFEHADAERLPFADATFDAILCECAFCTFPDKETAAQEFARVLKPGGRAALSDLTRSRDPLPGLDGLLAWVACIGDAQPLTSYVDWLKSAGLTIVLAEEHNKYLQQMVQQIRGKLLMAEVLTGLKKLNLAGLDLQQAKDFAKAAEAAVQTGRLGYGIIIGEKPRP